jgi:hypothetical protein
VVRPLTKTLQDDPFSAFVCNHRHDFPENEMCSISSAALELIAKAMELTLAMMLEG